MSTRGSNGSAGEVRTMAVYQGLTRRAALAAAGAVATTPLIVTRSNPPAERSSSTRSKPSPVTVCSTVSCQAMLCGVCPGFLHWEFPQGQKRSAKKNGPVVTRPFGREAHIVTLLHACWQQPLTSLRQRPQTRKQAPAITKALNIARLGAPGSRFRPWPAPAGGCRGARARTAPDPPRRFRPRRRPSSRSPGGPWPGSRPRRA